MTFMIRKFIIKALIKAANSLSHNERFISSKNLRIVPWLRDNGDKTHSLNHSLNEDSIVFDLGGYLGEWSKEIFNRYNCSIHIFEPVNSFCKQIEQNLKSEKIIINQFGLAQSTFETEIYICNEASSIHKKTGQNESIQLIDFMDYIKTKDITTIDLLKINIEGAEYDLLEYIIKTGYVVNISNIQVQFHDFFPDAEIRMNKIQENLSKTHRLTFQYPFIWENWQRIT